MKLILKEYGGVIAGAAAALPLVQLISEIFKADGIWMQAIQGFVSGIC